MYKRCALNEYCLYILLLCWYLNILKLNKKKRKNNNENLKLKMIFTGTKLRRL